MKTIQNNQCVSLRKTVTRSLSVLIGAVSCLWLTTGCDDYLDVVPEGDIQTVETIFEQRTDAYHWFKSCHVFLTDPATSFLRNPAVLGADELVAGQYARMQSNDKDVFGGLFIGDGLQMAADPYSNVWKKDGLFATLRYINIFLEQIDNCYNMTQQEKDLWKAEMKGMKANIYFEMMRRYGPIVLVPKNIDHKSEIAAMQQPRQPIDSCVNAIVKLCDEAIAELPTMKQKEQTRWAYYNKEAAATLKAYALLYAASPRFNGNVQFKDFVNKEGKRMFPDYDKEKWRKAAEAADEAIRICTQEAGKKLYSGTSSMETPLLNKINDIAMSSLDLNYANDEVILAFQRQNNLDPAYFIVPYVGASFTDIYDPNAEGCIAPSIKMVEMFYTEHGLPIEEDKQWLGSKYSMSKETDSRYKNVVPLNTDVMSLHRRREPRFYADIAADGTYWYRKMMKNGRSIYTPILTNMYQGANFGTQAKAIEPYQPQSLTGYWLKKWLVPDNPLASYTYNIGNYNLPQILFRLAELYLMSAEAWNEYLDQPNEHVYNMLDEVRVRAGIPKVRDAWTNYAKTPEKVKTKEGMREIIHHEWNNEFAFEGRRFWNLRRWMTAQNELNQPMYGWNILSNNAQGFYNNYEGPVVVWSKRNFTAPRDYLFPIRSEEILVSGVKQNPGW